jgi:hypothetical protein
VKGGILISVNRGRTFTRLENNSTKVEVAVKVSNYISDNSSVLLWVLEQNSTVISNMQLATLRLKGTPSEYVIVERKIIDLHNVSISGSAAFTDIVDDGRGNMVFFRRLYNEANVYFCWVDFSTGQGYFRGVLIPAANDWQLCSIAVDPNRSLLYLGHEKYISVYTLVYDA